MIKQSTVVEPHDVLRPLRGHQRHGQVPHHASHRRQHGQHQEHVGNQLGKVKQAVARAERNGAPGGMTNDFGYHVRANRNLMTSGGNVTMSVDNAGVPGRTEGRLVTLTKTGAVKHVTDSATDGLKSRW